MATRPRYGRASTSAAALRGRRALWRRASRHVARSSSGAPSAPIERPVGAARSQQLVVRAARDDPAAVEQHGDLVGTAQDRRPVADDDPRRRGACQRVRSASRTAASVTSPGCRSRCRAAGPRAGQQRSGERDPLALAAGQADAAIADGPCRALRQRGDEVVGLRHPRRRLHVLARGLGARERDVLPASCPRTGSCRRSRSPPRGAASRSSTSPPARPGDPTSPPVGSRRRLTSASSVDLPDPVVPRTAIVRPAGTSRSTPSTIGSPARARRARPASAPRAGVAGSGGSVGEGWTRVLEASSTRHPGSRRRLGRPSVSPPPAPTGPASRRTCRRPRSRPPTVPPAIASRPPTITTAADPMSAACRPRSSERAPCGARPASRDASAPPRRSARAARPRVRKRAFAATPATSSCAWS